VSLPNGTPEVPVVDLRVKVLGGQVTIDRQWWEGQWRVNLRWAPAEWAGYPSGEGGCLAYPEIKIQGRTYTGDGQAWMLENRYNVRAIDHFTGNECLANRTRKLKWQDRISGQWMEYERVDMSTLHFRLTRYGDKNNNTVNLAYDEAGQLTEIRDHHNQPVLQYIYTGGRLSEIRDVPNTDDPSPARSVKYSWGTSTVNGQAIPVINQVTDVLGNLTRYTIAAGQLQTLTDPEGRIGKYSYTADRVTSYTDGESKITQYVYDYDKLKREFYVRITSPSGTQTEQWYDSEGQLIRRDIAGQTTSKRTAVDTVARSETRADAAGRQTTITRDEYGNLIKTQSPDGSSTSAKYSAQHGQMIEETDELGIKTKYDHDGKGNLLKKTEAVGQPEQRITEYEVDAYGQVLKETRKGGSVTLPGGQTVTVADASVSYVYGPRGNRTQVTDPQGKPSYYTYDVMGNVTQLTDPAGRIWKAGYDAAGHLIARIDPLNQRSEITYDKVGNRIKNIDALGNTTSFVVNGQNRVTQAINALGGVRKTDYDTQGRVIAEVNEAGQTVVRNTYDAQGQLLSTQNAAGNTVTYDYDPTLMPFIPVRIKAAGLTREMRFDARGRLIEQAESWREADVNGIEQVRSTVSKSVYNQKGQLITSIDRLGQQTHMAYDTLGRLKSVTDAQGGITQFTYDAHDNLLSLTDANGNTTRFEYDANNRKTKETRPLGQSTSYSYDAVGQLVETIDAQGNKQRYTYDNAGRVHREEHLNTAGTIARTITYAYNAVGSLTGIADSNTEHAEHRNWQSAITLDALQRKIKEEVTIGSQTVTFDTTYNATGKKSSQTLADGTPIAYHYDISGGTDSKGTDDLLSIDLPGAGSISIGARIWGQPSQVTYPGGSQRQIDYDPLSRPKKILVKTPGQQVLMSLGYQFDGESNISQKNTEYGTFTYGYDNLYRLTQAIPDIASGPGLPAERYTYDKVGNRLTDNNRPNPNHSDKTWRYDSNNQLLESATEDTGLLFSNSQPVTHTWDANGSLIQKTTPANEPYNNQKFLYDAGNRLTEVQDKQGNPIASYQYDPPGRRIRKTEYRAINGTDWLPLDNPRTTLYYYVDEGLAAEYVQDGPNPAQLKAQYGWEPNGMWGAALLFLKAQKTGQATPNYFYYQNDHLGAPQQLIDAAGSLVWAQRAEAFGKTTVVLEDVANPLRFPGQYYDKEANTHYNYFRDYDPGQGRYVQKDPIGLNGGRNLYAYVEGSPLKYSDPQGLVKWSGEVYSVALIPGIGGAGYWFDLKSECVNGRYAYIRVKAWGFGAGFGAKLTGGAGGVKFDDGLSEIFPDGFTGTFRALGANAGIGLVGGWSWYQVGNNFSDIGWAPSPTLGFDFSIMGVKGKSEVVSVDWKRCSCE
jgi:RHS repeat-associated protein